MKLDMIKFTRAVNGAGEKEIGNRRTVETIKEYLAYCDLGYQAESPDAEEEFIAIVSND